jgi:hypothetical protein
MEIRTMFSNIVSPGVIAPVFAYIHLALVKHILEELPAAVKDGTPDSIQLSAQVDESTEPQLSELNASLAR